jgi:undecaprenyl-diphosphatase
LDLGVRGGLREFGAPVAFWVFWSWFGAGAFVSMVTVGVIVALLATARRLDAMLAPLVLGGSYLLMAAMKGLVGRTRPPLGEAAWTDEVDPLRLASWDPASGSFPSGHALHALVVYGFLVRVLPLRMQPFAGAGAFALVLLVGVSRVALGAHWPTDVLGSWLLGAAWLLTLVAARAVLAPAAN